MKNSGYKERSKQSQYLKNYLIRLTNCPNETKRHLSNRVCRFVSDIKSKWEAADRKVNAFLNNKDWLEFTVSFPRYCTELEKKKGRPSINFCESSERTKRQKTETLRSTVPVSELAYATQMSMRSMGQVEASKLVKEISFTTPKRAAKYRKAFEAHEKCVIRKLTGDEALSMIVEAKLTRHQYQTVRSHDKEKFPCYKIIQQAKKLCYPDKDAITITSTSAEVKLQQLVDHTAERLISVQMDVMEALKSEQLTDLYLISKWGCDGSSGQSQYKQKFEQTDDSDANIFFTSFVPLRLVSGDPNLKENIVIWKNPRPSSPRFCRPIRMRFVHETTEISVKEMEFIEEQISALDKTYHTIKDMNFVIKHIMLFTMIDGKICNAVTETTSTQKCYMCGATSKMFNNIDTVVLNKVDESKLRFGLSILHAWIRFFECLLHVAYKLPIQKWQARGKELQGKVAENKKIIQERFKSVGLIVDQPKPGFGTSNDGNTARRFFENPDLSARITGIDVEIIKRFQIVLQTISSGHNVDTNKFRQYALDTARLFVARYPWYYMPPTVHKILIHGPEVMNSALLPIGELSEEAQEARNKDIKKYREGFSRKSSRQNTNEDIFNMLLISSDPLISSLRELPKKKLKNFSAEVLDMLLPANTASRKDDSNCESSSDGDSDGDSEED